MKSSIQYGEDPVYKVEKGYADFMGKYFATIDERSYLFFIW